MKFLIVATMSLMALLTSNVTAQSVEELPEKLIDFTTETGTCSVTFKKDLQLKYLEDGLTFVIPKTYVNQGTSIFRRRGISPPTGNNLKPLQSVLCLANAGERILVTSVAANDNACGWVLKENLAQMQGTDGSRTPCGELKPLKVKDFCKIASDAINVSPETEKLIEGCYISGVKDTYIDTKFITDNTTARRMRNASSSELTMRKVPLFETSNADQSFSSVDIFSVNKAFDAVSKNDGSIRILIGDRKGPKGWTDLNNGHVWYSTLTTYFKPNGTEPVYLQKIVNGGGENINPTLASKPAAQSFNVAKDFAKFPVLFDMRKPGPMTPPLQAPQLEIAFIGQFCSGNTGKMCSSDEYKYTQALNNLRAADVVFLIDGSKSMSEYFGLVAESLTRFTEEYIGNPDYRFGVAMYGDFKGPKKTRIGDPIDYKVILDLEPNYLGSFSSVENAELLIFDALKDKPEAAHAAVFKAAKDFEWAENKPHFLIHIADHGDRQRPNKKIFNALAKENIFYVPIAVEGEAVLKESQTFIDDAKIYARNHTTKNGNAMAVPAIKSYGNGQSNARESIANALVQATSGWPNLGDGSSSEGDILPVLDAAAKEIFNIPESDDIRLLAATGYIGTSKIGLIEENWDYFVSLNEGDLNDLKEEMGSVCGSLGAGDSSKTITTTVFNMVRLLTGDKKPVDELISIWREGSIPLQTETIIGSGIKNLLLAASTDEDLTPYKKEFCRTSALLELMQKNFKVKVAEESFGLSWQDQYFEAVQPFKFDWRYTDVAGATRLYIPLDYLPRPLN